MLPGTESVQMTSQGDRVLNVRQLGKSAWVGSALLALPLVVIALLAATVLPASAARLATLFLIYVTAVLGNQRQPRLDRGLRR